MKVIYRVAGLKRLQQATKLAPGFLADRNAIALRRSLDLLEGKMIAATPRGPGHFGYHAVDKFSTRMVAGLKRQVGILKSGAPQLRWREGGTRAHEIAPRGARRNLGLSTAQFFALAIAGRLVATVHHPGEKARHTMRNVLRESKPAIRGYFLEAAQEMTKRMAGPASD